MFPYKKLCLSALPLILNFPVYASSQGTYVVVLNDSNVSMSRSTRPSSMEERVNQVLQRLNAEPKPLSASSLQENQSLSAANVYRNLSSFSVEMSQDQASQLRAMNDVKGVYRDVIFTADGELSTASEPVASWGLDRSDQRNLPLDGRYNVGQYTGKGVSIYVIDSGIDFSHPDFEGRAISGWDFVDSDGDASDCHGHGTHVAGTAAGKQYGIAPDADIYSVRVLNCDNKGWGSDILESFDWVIEHAKQRG